MKASAQDLLRPTTQSKPIDVVSVRTMKNSSGALKAFVSVRVGGVTIHDMRVIQQDGKSAWVACPQKEIPDKSGGKSKYFPIVEFTDDLKERVSDAVLAEWGNYNGDGSDGPQI